MIMGLGSNLRIALLEGTEHEGKAYIYEFRKFMR
jgi:hypothetical protein